MMARGAQLEAEMGQVPKSGILKEMREESKKYEGGIMKWGKRKTREKSEISMTSGETIRRA